MSILLESKQNSFVIDEAAYAVADAMMVAQANLLLCPLKLQKDFEDEDELGMFVDLKTDGYCTAACVSVIEYIFDKKKNLFQSAAMLEARKEDMPFKKNDWRLHNYFLLRDTKDIWYAGSPANYIFNEPENNQRLTRVISSPDLTEVVSKIEDIEGGLWPTAEIITKILNKRKEWGFYRIWVPSISGQKQI